MKSKEIKKDNFKSIISCFKTIGWLAIIIYCVMCLSLIILTTSYSLDISKYSLEELKQDEMLISYTSDLNSYSYSETIELFLNIEDKFEFMLFELILPSVFLLFGYILLIISLKDIISLIKNVTEKKMLFTKEKYQLLKKIILRTDIALLFIVGNVNISWWVSIGIILEIILYLINYCVEQTKD